MELIGNTQVIKVKKDTNVEKLTNKLYEVIKDGTHETLVKVIGAGALNQAIKAVMVANKTFIDEGKAIHILPSFFGSQADNEISGIDLKLKLQTL